MQLMTEKRQKMVVGVVIKRRAKRMAKEKGKTPRRRGELFRGFALFITSQCCSRMLLKNSKKHEVHKPLVFMIRLFYSTEAVLSTLYSCERCTKPWISPPQPFLFSNFFPPFLHKISLLDCVFWWNLLCFDEFFAKIVTWLTPLLALFLCTYGMVMPWREAGVKDKKEEKEVGTRWAKRGRQRASFDVLARQADQLSNQI